MSTDRRIYSVFVASVKMCCSKHITCDQKFNSWHQIGNLCVKIAPGSCESSRWDLHRLYDYDVTCTQRPCLDIRGRCSGKKQGPLLRHFPFSRNPLSFPRAVRGSQRVDKMALYNFKKIMVVPTAKVSFVRCVWRLGRPLFFFYLRRRSAGGTEEDVRKHGGRKHVLQHTL